jgi:hypothetical protein
MEESQCTQGSGTRLDLVEENEGFAWRDLHSEIVRKLLANRNRIETTLEELMDIPLLLEIRLKQERVAFAKFPDRKGFTNLPSAPKQQRLPARQCFPHLKAIIRPAVNHFRREHAAFIEISRRIFNVLNKNQVKP